MNIVPQEDATTYRHGNQEVTSARSNTSQPFSLPFVTSNTSVNSMPTFLSEQPNSLPTNMQPFTSNLPHFEQHYHSVKDHHEMLQQQLSDHIKDFLAKQEANIQSIPSDNPTVTHEPMLHSQPSVHEPSLHWQPPAMSEFKFEDNPSRSIMFGSLRYAD